MAILQRFLVGAGSLGVEDVTRLLSLAAQSFLGQPPSLVLNLQLDVVAESKARYCPRAAGDSMLTS